MIKVIEHSKDKTFYAKCDKCATTMEYQVSDVEFKKLPGYSTESKMITCPDCGQIIFVSLLTKEEFDIKNSTTTYGLCCSN